MLSEVVVSEVVLTMCEGAVVVREDAWIRVGDETRRMACELTSVCGDEVCEGVVVCEVVVVREGVWYRDVLVCDE